MIIEFPTWANHGFENADGSASERHCCGCWSVKINQDEPFKPWIACNECGEVRSFGLPPGVVLS